MLRWHRLVVLVAGLLITYVAVTGAIVEFADMRALVLHAPESDPAVLLMRQHHNGPANYFVVSEPDYSADPLPAAQDLDASMHRAAELGHLAEPQAQLRLVELRMYQHRAVGHVQLDEHHVAFDLLTGEVLPPEALPRPPLPNGFTSTRQDFKALHRFNFLGPLATVPDLLVGLAFLVLIVTGVIHYVRVYRRRRQIGRTNPFWKGGGIWRVVHRWVSVLSILVVLSLSITGTLLAVNSIGVPLYQSLHPRQDGRNPFESDFSTPLRDDELSPMTSSTLKAFHKAMPATAIKVIRLRYFSGYPQGAVVAADPLTSQLVFNTATGSRMGLSETNYPQLGMPFGWEWNQRLKRIHRGDVFGMSGRWVVMAGGLAVLYLSISGLYLYGEAWLRRYRSGRPALLWK